MKLSKKKNILTLIIVCLLGLAGCGGSRHKTSLNKPLFIHRSAQPDKKTKKITPPEAKRNPEYLTFDELKISKDHYISIGKYDLAIKCVEELLKKTSDIKCLQEARLELCDLYFETGQLEQASKLYTAYRGMYPGSEHRVDAEYQGILCRFYLSLSADRDQTKTHETLVYVHDYLEHYKKEPHAYSIYLADVENIKKQCSQKLYDSDLNIYNFYLSRSNYKACQVHLENMEKRFTVMLPERKPDIIKFECAMAEKLNQPELLALKTSELKEHYPEDYTTMVLAKNQQSHKPAVVRF